MVVAVCGQKDSLRAVALCHGEAKHAYDLFYLLRNYGQGVGQVAAEVRPLLPDESTRRGLE